MIPNNNLNLPINENLKNNEVFEKVKIARQALQNVALDENKISNGLDEL